MAAAFMRQAAARSESSPCPKKKARQKNGGRNIFLPPFFCFNLSALIFPTQFFRQLDLLGVLAAAAAGVGLAVGVVGAAAGAAGAGVGAAAGVPQQHPEVAG
jgi:hypothetical protein